MCLLISRMGTVGIAVFPVLFKLLYELFTFLPYMFFSCHHTGEKTSSRLGCGTVVKVSTDIMYVLQFQDLSWEKMLCKIQYVFFVHGQYVSGLMCLHPCSCACVYANKAACCLLLRTTLCICPWRSVLWWVIAASFSTANVDSTLTRPTLSCGEK